MLNVRSEPRQADGWEGKPCEGRPLALRSMHHRQWKFILIVSDVAHLNLFWPVNWT